MIYSDLLTGFQTSGGPIQSTTSWANQFVTPGTSSNVYPVSDIQLAIASQNPNTPTNVGVALFTNGVPPCAGGTLLCPGTQLFTGVITNVGYPGGIMSIPVPPGINLTGNTPYWVLATWPGGNVPFGTWYYNGPAPGIQGNVWFINPISSAVSEGTLTLFGFAVNGASPTVIPEPSTLLLIGSIFPGTLGWVWVRRRTGRPR